MSISRIKQIKRILKEHDVRDPRGALQAIEQVVSQPKAEKPETTKPLLQMALIKTGPKTLEIAVQFDRDNLQPRHLVKAIESLNEFGNDVFGGECDDPTCPVHGNAAAAAAEPLSELFKKFEEAALAANKNKGNLQ